MTTITTSTADAAWRPDVTGFAPADLVPEALILQCSTVSGQVHGDEPALRVAYVADDDAAFVSEGATIDEANPGLDEVVVHTGKIAQLVRLSAEQYGQLNTANLVSDSMRRAVTTAANKAFIQQAAPTSPAVTPPAGIINVSGINDGGAVATNLDKLIDLFATIEGNGGTPTHVLLAPDAWASLRKFKTATSSEQGILGAGTNDSERLLLDVPVTVTSALATGTGMVIDKTAVVSAVGQVRLAVSDAAYFNSDAIGVRVTWRFGQNVVRTNRIGKFTVTDPDDAG